MVVLRAHLILQFVILNRVAASSNINISSLMSEAYRAIGDPDGIYGCSTDRRGSTIARSVKTVNDLSVVSSDSLILWWIGY